MTIRDATKNDAIQCAPLIYQSAVHKFDYGIGAFGDDPVAVIADAFESYLYQFHKVVERDNKIVGVGAYYTTKAADKTKWQALRWAYRYYGLTKLPRLSYRMYKLTQLQNPLDKNTLYVTNIGVNQNYQGQGIGTMIVEAFAKEAIKRGYHYGLDVAVDNDRAIKLYERLGFEYQWQKSFTGDKRYQISDSCRYVRNPDI